MDARLPFSPALRDWILENIDRGVPPEPLARTLAEQGLAPGAAQALVATFWSARARGTPLPEGAIDLEQADAAHYRPQPSRLAAGNTLSAGDRQVRVAVRIERPMVAVLDGVFSADECDELVALARPRLQASTIVDPGSGEDVASMARNSRGMFFRAGENALIGRIDRRLAELMQLPQAHGEALQVLCYGPGAQSAPHFDFLMPTHPANQASVQRSGQRVSTLVAYLNEPEEGGETVFPEAGIAVAPRKGSALYFEYCNDAGQLDPLSLHAALPVIRGEKWVATRWMRQRPFRAAGER